MNGEGKFGWRGWLGLAIGLGVTGAFFGGIAILNAATRESAAKPHSTTVPIVINDPGAPDDQVEGDWYCWDKGEPRPHHLGHYVVGDHLCTWGELRAAGFAR